MKSSKSKSKKRKKKSPGIIEKLSRLLAEKARREALRARSEQLSQLFPGSPKDEGTPAEIWKKKREAWTSQSSRGLYEPLAGEIANMLEGLTPDGYDRNGRKVSFVEIGKPLHEEEKAPLISVTNLDIFGRR